MVLHQICYEAPALFLLFQAYFQEQDFFLLETAAAEAGVSSDDWKRFVAYVAGFYGNMSNYHSFGHMKFVPEMSSEVLLKILHSNPLYNDTDAFYREVVDEIYPQVEAELFHHEKPYTQLNFPYEGGVTGYFGRNLTAEDLQLVKEFLMDQKIDVLNTRAFKSEDGRILITVGSISTNGSKTDIEFKGRKFDVQYGEFAPYLQECNTYLKEALKYCANDNQENMVKKYIEHFESGSVDAHKDSQRFWVKDYGPVVESNMGWVETYIDPENSRAYFEGWVAIVDKEKSKKFRALVENSEQIIPQLPWPQFMEKEKFLAPDFTTLEIICFATNSCPLGINIPNYDDIRDHEGFKNVFLGNSMPSYAQSAVEFATEEQCATLSANTLRCYEVHVACHELLGHGVGRLIYRNEDGSETSFTDPITGEQFNSCYEKDDTWNTRFGAISTSYEECRADTCGFYLCTLKDVYSLFGFEDHEVDTLLWVNVMSQFRKGILGLTLYNPETKKWGQAHTQGAFVFAMWLYKNQKSKIVEFEIVGENQDDIRIHLDQANLVSEGKELIRQLLVVLQTYKCSGNVTLGKQFYDSHSEVSDFFLKVRGIVLARKKPRRVELNNNLIRLNESNVFPRTYPETFESIILSYADRYQFNKRLYNQVKGVWDEHKSALRVSQ
jgi:dipeptidyl-peptidase-3